MKTRILQLLENHSHDLTIEDISQKLKINRSTASKYLAILEATGHVQYRSVGKAKLFSVVKR